MLIKVQTNSRDIDLIIDEVVKKKCEEGLGIDQWRRILEICIYMEISCDRLAREIDEIAREIKPTFTGLKLQRIEDRRKSFETLDTHLSTTHLQDFDSLLERIKKRLEPEANEFPAFSLSAPHNEISTKNHDKQTC